MKANPKQPGSNSGRVLQDHLQKGSIFFLPSTCTASGPRWNLIKWRAAFLPELIWLARLVNDFGYDKANELACALAVTTTKVAAFRKDFGSITGYSFLSQDLKASVCSQLQKIGVLDDIVRSLAPLLHLYPSCPLGFLSAGKLLKISEGEAAEKLAPIITQCLSRSEKLTMLAQEIYYNVCSASGDQELRPPLNTAALKDYPNTPEDVVGLVRAQTTGIAMRRISDEWPKYFWRRGAEFGPCVSEDPAVMASGHNIANTDDRWNWITTPTTGIWDIWVNLSSTDKTNQVSVPLTTRAVTYSLLFTNLLKY